MFKLTELKKLDRNRLIDVGGQAVERIHTARLKSRLLSHYEGLTEFKQRKNTFLAFDMEADNAFKNVRQRL